MAESKGSARDNNEKHRKKQKSKDKDEMSECRNCEEGQAESIPECAVCLQTCVHPAKLPCGHIFCFLCLKGLASQNRQSRRCAMCREDIPLDYLDHPNLLEMPTQLERETLEDGYQWFYEGRSGWWQYEERTSRELEAAYKGGQRTCELLIVGQLYIADFDAMLQLRCNDLSRRRRIKRDLASIPKKGIAGLRVEGASDSSDTVAINLESQPTVPEETESLPHNSAGVAAHVHTAELSQNDQGTDYLVSEDHSLSRDDKDSTANHENEGVHSADRDMNGDESTSNDQSDLENQVRNLLIG